MSFTLHLSLLLASQNLDLSFTIAGRSFEEKVMIENTMIWKGGKGVQWVPEAMNAHLGVALLLYDTSSDSVLLIVEKRSRVNRHTQEVENFTITKPVTGSVDLGEHPEQAARREMHEEVGIDLEQLKLLQLRTMDTKTSINSNNVLDTCIYFGAKVDKPLAIGKLASEEGITHAEWIPREELPARRVSDKTIIIANKFKIEYEALRLGTMFANVFQ